MPNHTAVSLDPFRAFDHSMKRVIDGDTVVIDIDLGFNTWLHDEYVRLIDYDAPERRDELGPAATAAVKEWFATRADIEFLSYKLQKGKYGRILGDFVSDGETLTAFMKARGLVKAAKA